MTRDESTSRILRVVAEKAAKEEDPKNCGQLILDVDRLLDCAKQTRRADRLLQR